MLGPLESLPSSPVPAVFLNEGGHIGTASELTHIADGSPSAGFATTDIPFRRHSGEVLRRRGETAGVWPRRHDPHSDIQEVIELDTIEEILGEGSESVRAAASALKAQGDVTTKGSDVENAPGTYISSVGPSERVAEVEISPVQLKKNRWHGKVHLAALCYQYFLEGWNDGSLGPLLPRLQSHYKIGFDVISLLFVFMALGFIGGAMANVYLNHYIGFGKVVVLGATLQLVGYIMIAPGGPFPVMCAGVTFAGFGIAMQMAQANGFVGSLSGNTRLKFGILHSCYGLGAFVSPLVATHFASAPHWSYHYLIAACIAVSNVVILASVFRFRNQDDVMAEAGEAPTEISTSSSNDNLYHQILRLKEVHLLSLFCLIYVGVEVSIGGWIVTFIEDKRGGGSSAGYISSGFFGGLMLGRIVLMWLNHKLGERWSIIVYGLVVIGLEITVWVVPSLVENAVAVAVVGLLLGPMYPIMMNHSTSILPKWLRTGSMGYIAGIGQTGSAVLPLLTGVLASKLGIGAMQPLVISMMSTMIVIWAMVPRTRHIE
ncbi:MFS general substrate transporter [Wolfiporia cocos MD-104 SS10]|uniref:MFS general substrate transporter n=1 Tax=Wolfiporia cocos (strain MD-104) TaxID=742152 RepID=A0A2H3J9G5_WOLCO|nr:MFS general substrate transporter [Wolfiporia cocos MD-104 SS10]